MTFCTQCGAPIPEGLRFCTQCGAAVSSGGSDQVESATTAETAAQTPALPSSAQPPVALSQKKSGVKTVVVVALAILVVLGGLSIGGGYLLYRSVKKKVTAAFHTAGPVRGAVEQNSAFSTPDASPSGATRSGQSSTDALQAANDQPTYPAWSGDSGAGSSSGPGANAVAGLAPLRKGMLVVTAVADFSGDYESFKQIQSIDTNGVTLSYKSEHPARSSGEDKGTPQKPETRTSRTVLARDLNNAHDYAEIFSDNDPSSFPGSTAISASREVLAQLKQQGTTQFSFRPDGLKGAVASVVNTLSSIAGIDPKDIGDGSLARASKEQCTLSRVGNQSVAFPVLLNNEPTTVPAVHAQCRTDDGLADFYMLDQPGYPLMLSWKLGQGSHLQVIKITYPVETHPKNAPPPPMETDLAEKKKVEIYGIYFDFASDRLKPESKPVLDEIAQVMNRHPDWTLLVSGHTDNIGGDSYNLDLSRRRAAAVKRELVSTYHIAPDRLTTDGFGASRPIDTNDTLEGRARNRRVELSRR